MEYNMNTECKTPDPKFHIESSKKTDYNEIAKMIKNSPELNVTKTESEIVTTLTHRIDKMGARSIVIKNNGEILCHCSTLFETDKVALLGAIVTKKEHRGKGMATNIITKIICDLKEEGKKIQLFAYEQNAIRLYSKLGFSIVSEWFEFE